MRNISLSLIIIAFSVLIVSGQQTDTMNSSKFTPFWGTGIFYYYEYGNAMIGFKFSYNLELFSGKTGSLALEPAISFGGSFTNSRYGAEAVVSANMSLFYRQKLGPFIIGLGPSYDLTSAHNASGELGSPGLTSRLGYIFSEKLFLEINGNYYLNTIIENNIKMGTGINLVRLIGED